jgi:hypothetical protein
MQSKGYKCCVPSKNERYKTLDKQKVQKLTACK